MAVELLSERARQVLRLKALEWRMTDTQALEALVLEFSHSTLEDRKIQRDDKAKALFSFLYGLGDEGTAPVVETAWRSGFRSGWRLFQLRRKDSVLRRMGHGPEEITHGKG